MKVYKELSHEEKRLYLGILIIVICIIVSGITLKKERKTYDIDTSLVDNIIVTEEVNNVKVKPSNDSKIHVTYSEGKNSSYKIEKKDSVLNISTSEPSVNIGIVIDIVDSSLIIEIPKDYKKDLQVTTKKEWSVDKSIQFKSVNIVNKG